MAERRKIIIETGANADEPLPTPHFDVEATLTARPVVPLTDQENYQTPQGGYAGRAAAKPFWKRPAMLALIVFVAVGIGVAAGLTIGVYRNRQATNAPVAAAANEPSPTVEDANEGQIVEQPQPAPTEQTRAVIPDEPEEIAVDEKDEKDEEREERTARNERRDDDNDEVRQPAAVVKPPVAREKKPVKVDERSIEDEREARQAEKEQRREERRAERRERRRRGREDEIYVPRGIERAGREVDRIREIFEGRRP
jgi:type IV secretory pathway VirB10-like protein